MRALALLCGDDFLSKLQPNSGLEHATGDADSSPTPISVQHAPENRSPPSQSHITALAKGNVNCPNAQLLVEAFFTTSPEPQLHRSLLQSRERRQGTPLWIDEQPNFSPAASLRTGAALLTWLDLWHEGLQDVKQWKCV
jgi:hypothetical protein